MRLEDQATVPRDGSRARAQGIYCRQTCGRHVPGQPCAPEKHCHNRGLQKLLVAAVKKEIGEMNFNHILLNLIYPKYYYLDL